MFTHILTIFSYSITFPNLIIFVHILSFYNHRMSKEISWQPRVYRCKIIFYNVKMIKACLNRQNGRHCIDNIFKHIVLNEIVSISIEISLIFVPKGPINNILALVQIMPCLWPSDKPLSAPMLDYWCIYASLGLNDLSESNIVLALNICGTHTLSSLYLQMS